MTLEVTYRTVASLTPAGRNPRTHTKEQIDQIAASITAFGWTAPILVDGENGILAGHGRLAAAKKLKMTEVPVIELAGLSPTEKRAYLIADNQLAIDAGWDFDVLGGEVKDLQLAEFDLNLLGFADPLALINEPEPEEPAKPRGTGTGSLQYNLIFETEEQRRVWFTFMRRLKGDYPEIETLGERLFMFLKVGGHIGAR
jgi:ParB-like chromosome segregation protein Spo0J